MLGSDVVSAAPSNVEAVATDIRGDVMALDLTDVRAVHRCVADIAPDVVIHCAAFTDVEGAELHEDTAYRVNALGTWALASACATHGASLLYISTDYVFDGVLDRPYHEFDRPNPLSVYARTKYAGEQAATGLCPQCWIVRTAWLFGLRGRSFVRTILGKVRAGETVRVVADQVGSPTFTADLAQALWEIVPAAPYGTYHRVNEGSATWYELALEVARRAGVDPNLVRPVSTQEWPSRVQRPRYSVLGSLTSPAAGLSPLRPWQEAVAEFVGSLDVELGA